MVYNRISKHQTGEMYTSNDAHAHTHNTFIRENSSHPPPHAILTQRIRKITFKYLRSANIYCLALPRGEDLLPEKYSRKYTAQNIFAQILYTISPMLYVMCLLPVNRCTAGNDYMSIYIRTQIVWCCINVAKKNKIPEYTPDTRYWLNG